jgi:phosphonate transport system substrate-binding protein
LRFITGQRPGGIEPLAGARAFAKTLGDSLDHDVSVEVALDYAAITQAVVSGRAHVAWMPPVAHARATLAGAWLVAVAERQGALAYRSALLVRTDSIWTAPSGLRGVRAAWTDPSSASGWLFPRLHLLASGLDPKRDIASERFYGSPDRALAAVAHGEADLCACYVRNHAPEDAQAALDDAEQVFRGAREQLRVLAVTDLIPPDGVVLGPGLDGAGRKRVTAALLGMHQLPAGRAALGELMQAERLVEPTTEVQRLVARLRAHAPVK